MSFKLEIIFRGLCVFVNSSESNQSAEAVAVFLIDGRAPGVADKRVKPGKFAGAPHFSHVPAVKFFVEDLDDKYYPAAARPDYSLSRRKDETKDMGVWILDGDDLSIEQLPEGNVGLQQSFIDFIPSIDEFHGNKLKVNADCFKKTKELSKDLTEVGLVGRLGLRGGAFVGELSRIDPDLARVDPRTGAVDPESGKENFAVFVTDIKEPVVAIRSSKGTVLSLAPKDASRDSKVTVVIENVPPPKIVTVKDYSYDFELIYRIADGFTRMSELKVEPLKNDPARMKPEGIVRNGTAGPCGSSRFAADSNVIGLFNQ